MKSLNQTTTGISLLNEGDFREETIAEQKEEKRFLREDKEGYIDSFFKEVPATNLFNSGHTSTEPMKRLMRKFNPPDHEKCLANECLLPDEECGEVCIFSTKKPLSKKKDMSWQKPESKPDNIKLHYFIVDGALSIGYREHRFFPSSADELDKFRYVNPFPEEKIQREFETPVHPKRQMY